MVDIQSVTAENRPGKQKRKEEEEEKKESRNHRTKI